MTYFTSFCWLWDYLLENLKLNSKYEQVWIIYFLVQISFFWDCFRECFSQCNLKFFPCRPTDGRHFYWARHHKTASYGRDYRRNITNYRHTSSTCIFHNCLDEPVYNFAIIRKKIKNVWFYSRIIAELSDFHLFILKGLIDHRNFIVIKRKGNTNQHKSKSVPEGLTWVNTSPTRV